jgi:uncharacterized protein YndB with AHSA1/START domain
VTEFGTVRRDGELGAVRFERVYAAAPEAVWSAWTAPDRLGRWMGAAVVGPIAAGGSFTLVWGEEPAAQVVVGVDELDPPRRLAWRWTLHGEPPTVLTVTLTPDGAGTRLRLDHTRLPLNQAAGLSAGWHNHLDALVADAETGEWWPRHVDAYRERLHAL